MPINTDGIPTQAEVPTELNFTTVLNFAKKLQGIIFKRQDAIQHAKFDGWAAILESLRKNNPWGEGLGLTFGKNRVKDYFNDVEKKYREWKADRKKLLAIMAEHYGRVESDILKQKPSNFTLMAKIMTREDFLDFGRQPGVITEAECTNPPTDEYVMVLYAQSCLETGRFTSFKYKNDGNMFGMQASSKRKKLYVSKYETKSGAEKGWWPEYKDQRQSFIDRLNWDAYNRIQYITFDKYVRFVLGDNINKLQYATDPNYAKKWWGWIKIVFDEAGMPYPYVDPQFVGGGGNPDAGNDGSDPGGSNPPSTDGFGWKMWAGIAAIAAIVIYALFNRE